MKSLKREKDFDRVYQDGKTIKNNLFKLYYLKNDHPTLRLSVVTPKRLGGAVVRNRLRRRFVEAARRANFDSLCYDVVIFPGAKAKNEEFSAIKAKLAEALGKL